MNMLSSTSSSSASLDPGEEVFNYCSDSRCPRDIQFHCEKLTEYLVAQKERKPVAEDCKALVHSVLANHGLTEFQLGVNTNSRKFHCSLCNQTCEAIQDCLKHVLQDYHQRMEMIKQVEFSRDHLPLVSAAHAVALERCLLRLEEEQGLAVPEMLRRIKLVEYINRQLAEQNIDAALEVYGSSLTGLGFHDSDLNVTVNAGRAEMCPHTGRKARPCRQEEETCRKTIDFFQNHSQASEFSISPFCKRVNMVWRTKESEGTLKFTLNRMDKVNVDTSKLVVEYTKLSPHVRPLVVAFRTWAKLCEVDDGLQEGLPPFALDVMVIYFLQSRNILPVLDPGSREIAKPCEEPINPTSQGFLGRLWVDLLKFYSGDDLHKAVISVTGNSAPVESNEKKIIIEEPVAFNLSKKPRLQISPQMTEYIRQRLCAAYVYFATPRTLRGHIYDAIFSQEFISQCSPYVFHKCGVSVEDKSSNNDTVEPVEDPKWDIISLAEQVKGDKGRKLVTSNPFRKFGTVKVRMLRDHRKKWNVLLEDVAVLSDLFPEWLYQYEFTNDDLQGKTKPPVFCKTCLSKHHYFPECSEESIPAAISIQPNIPPDCLRRLNDAMELNYDIEALTAEKFRVRQEILNELQQQLSRVYPHATLQFFGSSVNGFGTPASDIDICITFDESGKTNEETLSVINKVNKMLLRLKNYQVIYFVRHARVPIVKFRHLPSNLEGDISCSNPLAIRNSQLLRTYASIDPRVKVLGYFFKKLVKICDISSASKSTLSSYGHTLLVLYFLQQLPHPVLPVLQELQNEPEELVNGWNVQYFKDIDNLVSIWPDYGKNRESPAELLLNLLRFYTEEFDFENRVVSIRQKAPVTRLSNFWVSHSLIAIEDPFEFSHNIGNCLSRKKSVLILNTFWKFRQVFQATYSDKALRKHRNWLEFYTDRQLIQYKGGSRSKKCAICHRVDHAVNDCPRKRKKRRVELENGPDSAETMKNANIEPGPLRVS